MKKLIITLFILVSTLSQAKVWEATPGMHWDAYWGQKFENWIKDEVEGDFFKKMDGYKDLPLDCADAMYAFKIYFSFKHRLHWKTGAHKWQRDREQFPYGFSNEMTNWDHLPTEEERVIQLISFLIDRVGTESLANLDTYPVAIHDVRAGDLFMYKFGSDGSYTRHTYIIKEVNVDGTFDVLYATQLRAKKLWGLGRIGAEYLQHKPDLENWGFKRMKSDLDIDTAQKDHLLSDYEQYEVAKRVEEHEFFDYANVSLRVIEESPTRKTNRLLQGLCRSLRAREIVVKDALEWQLQEENIGQCMNERDYDAYSTPSRDTGIMKKYDQLEFFYRQLEARNLKDKVNRRLRTVAESIFNDFTSADQEAVLEEFCKIEATDEFQSYNVNLRSFYHGLKYDTVSFHPNDNVFRRWGIEIGQPTTCHTFYGKKADEEAPAENNGGTQTEERRPNLLDMLFGGRN